MTPNNESWGKGIVQGLGLGIFITLVAIFVTNAAARALVWSLLAGGL